MYTQKQVCKLQLCKQFFFEFNTDLVDADAGGHKCHAVVGDKQRARCAGLVVTSVEAQYSRRASHNDLACENKV